MKLVIKIFLIIIYLYNILQCKEIAQLKNNIIHPENINNIIINIILILHN